MAVPSDHHHPQQQQQHQQQQRRSKKSKAGQKKQPQRGLGVAQLERLRIQEESKKAMLASSSMAVSAAGSCLMQAHHPGGRLCLSSPHNLHLHHLSAAGAAPPGSGVRSNLPFLSTIGASPRHPQRLDIPPQRCASIHGQLDPFLHSGGGGGGGAGGGGGDSSSCKSGISSDASVVHNLFGGRSSASPSPCSSSHKIDHAIADDSDESSRGGASNQHHPHFHHPPFVFLGSSSSSSSDANTKNNNSSNKNANAAFLAAIQPGMMIKNTTTTMDSSDMFDPSFRTRARGVHGDGRDWPGIYNTVHGVPAIKELSSFQIPGNTIPALSSPSKQSCWTGARDGAAEFGSGYSGKESSKIIAASSSPRSLSAASSLARSEVCFSFEQQLKDSCSSSLKNSNISSTNTIATTNLEATSSTKSDFLTLALAAASPQSRKRPSSSGLLLLPDSKASAAAAAADDAESAKTMIMIAAATAQEASGETDDHWLLRNCHQPPRKSIRLGPASDSSSPFMLELSLKVPSGAVEESSLELKLAL